MAENKTAKVPRSKPVAKKRPCTKSDAKTSVAKATDNQAQSMSDQQATVETGQVGGRSGSKHHVVSWIALLFSGLALCVGGVNLIWRFTMQVQICVHKTQSIAPLPPIKPVAVTHGDNQDGE